MNNVGARLEGFTLYAYRVNSIWAVGASPMGAPEQKLKPPLQYRKLACLGAQSSPC